MTPGNFTIKILPPSYRLTKEAERLMERIENPQDLWDGLLAVQAEEAQRKMIVANAKLIEGLLIGSILKNLSGATGVF